MSSETKNVTPSSPYRLPDNVVPTFYELHVEPDMHNFTFKGEEKVHVAVNETTQEVELNNIGLNIHDAALTDEAGTRLEGTVSYDEPKERATIKFDGKAGKGNWLLDLKYDGQLSDKLGGFYRSRYKDPSGTERFLATTKFEPCDARRAFPCFDEPAAKARFKLSMTIDEKLTALSNTRVLKETVFGNGKKLVEFAPTIKMSTYLVAFRAGNFVSSRPVIVDGKEVRIWCVPGKEHLAEFGLGIAKFALEYFARYFQQPYMGDKLDLVAIPDFASGAMEEFGCPAFRETALLIDLKTASHAELLRVAEVIMHELAHMWFGDFVTMRWWNGLWLNEAFATFMAAKCMHAFKKEWKFWEGFNVDKAAAMKVDGLIETRSIEFPVANPADARQMFDILTYEKGCALLRMLELFLGEEPFRHGIVKYLSKHQFGNADTPELWEAIEEVVPGFSERFTVKSMMDSWIYQPGFPVVEVAESPVSGSITLKQRIFRYLAGENDPKTTWQIPVHLRATVGGEEGKTETVDKVVVLGDQSETFYLGEDVSSVVVNAGGHGFYRVQYSDSLRKKLLDNLSVLSASERFNFVNDMWAAAQSGSMTFTDYWNTIIRLTGEFGETDLNVMNVVIGSFNTWRTIVDNHACFRTAMQDAVYFAMLDLAEYALLPVLDRIGRQAQEGESQQQAQLRGRLMTLLGELRHPEAVELSRELFGKWKQDKAAVDTNMIGAVVNTMAVVGDEAVYDEFLALKDKASTPQEENRFLMALTSFRDIKLAQRTLQACLDGTIRSQDAPMVIQALLGNTNTLGPDNADNRPVAFFQSGHPIVHNASVARTTWFFIRDNWGALVAKFPMQGVSRMCSGITSLVSKEMREDIADFFASHEVKGGEKLLKQSMEQQMINFQVIVREIAKFSNIFFNAGAKICTKTMQTYEEAEFQQENRDAEFLKGFHKRGLEIIHKLHAEDK